MSPSQRCPAETQGSSIHFPNLAIPVELSYHYFLSGRLFVPKLKGLRYAFKYPFVQDVAFGNVADTGISFPALFLKRGRE